MAKRTLSRKEMEEMKKRQDEEAAAEVLHQVGKNLGLIRKFNCYFRYFKNL